MFSELVTDLANEIILCQDWDPEKLHSPAQPQVPNPIRLSPGIPMAQAKPMSVVIPTPDRLESRVDGYIDDLINVFLDTPRELSPPTTSRPTGHAHHQSPSCGQQIGTPAKADAPLHP
jgi:hypothetical protein